MASETAPATESAPPHSNGQDARTLAPLALAALGVVYGDIGTSPLYALRECFAAAHGVPPTVPNVLGVLSLFFWALTLVIVVKYLTFIMRADNHGEGGILALLALLRGDRFRRSTLVTLGIFGAALLYGDGVITPAISVLSAMEGLSVATPRLEPFVVPLTIVILAALFVVQKRGTASVGAVFGPATFVWFIAIAMAGFPWVATHPIVLEAVSPWYAIRFFRDQGTHGFLLLGAVVLCITGGEALYADMGHFGRRPIRLAWYTVVMPALLLNYFGQGAMLLSVCAEGPGTAACQTAVDNPFYSILPESLVFPMVVLAAIATVVASQALISGAFSLTQQAVQLGFAPRVQILHTSATTEGQIYVPVVNWTLMVSCIALVLATGSSSKLAAAYGIAVTGTMSITSLLFYAVARRRWHWPKWKAVSLVTVFLVIDLAFFSSNLAKFFHGGWFPIILALGIYYLMSTWKIGGIWRSREYEKTRVKFEDFLTGLKFDPPKRVKGTAVFMTQDREGTPPALLHHLKHNQVLHEQLVILTIETRAEPTVPRNRRIQIVQLGHGFWRAIASYGFMETPSVPEIMRLAALSGLASVRGRTSFYLGRETFVPTGRSNLPRWRKSLFTFMARNARSPTDFYGIPPNDVVELGAQIQM
jgi:KUP system potassium uptake protein